MPDQFEQYYKYLKANGADVAPDFNSFKGTLSNYDNASKYYSYLKDNQFDVPETYDSFADTFGLKKKDKAVSLSVSSPTQSLSPDFEKGKAFAEKGFLMQPEGIKVPKEQEVEIEPVEKQGLILNTISSLDKAFAKGFSSPIKALGTALQGTTKKVLGGTGEGFVSDALIKFGDYLNNTIDELTPQDEEFKGTLVDQVAQAFGQVGSLVLTGGLTGAAGKGAALVSQVPKGGAAITAAKTLGSQLASPTAVSAGLSMGQAEFDRAIEAGANDDQAFEAFYKNAATGSVLETIPVMQFFKRFNNSTGGSVANYIKTKGVAGLTGGIEEMTTEVMQQLYSNKTAKDIYNINQDILDGVGSSGGIGFGVGFLLNAMGANAKILRKQGKQQEADVLENQVKQYEDNIENPKITSDKKTVAKDIVTQGVEIGTQKAVKSLDRDLANNVITPEQYQEGIVFAEKAAQVVDKIPETITGESRVKSMELLVERNDIKQANQILLQQKQTTDEAYHAGIDEEIKTNEERIKKLDTEVYNIAKKPSKEFGGKTYVVDGEEVSQAEFEALQGKPIGKKKVIKADVTQKTIPVIDERGELEFAYSVPVSDERTFITRKDYEAEVNQPAKAEVKPTEIEVTEEVKPIEVIKPANLEEEYDSKSVDELITLKNKLYPSPDIETPMTTEEKLLDRVIAKKFSEKQQEIISKRKAATGEVKPTETIEQADIIPATYKTINIDEEIDKNNEIIKKGNQLDKSFAKKANNDLLKAKSLGKKEYQSTEKPPKGYNLKTIGNKEYYAKQKEFKTKVKEEVKEKVKVYNAKELKSNPKVLEEDEDYNTINYPKSFDILYTSKETLNSKNLGNKKIGDVINIFNKDYVIADSPVEKNQKVKLIRVDKSGNILRRKDTKGKLEKINYKDIVNNPKIFKENRDEIVQNYYGMGSNKSSIPELNKIKREIKVGDKINFGGDYVILEVKGDKNNPDVYLADIDKDGNLIRIEAEEIEIEIEEPEVSEITKEEENNNQLAETELLLSGEAEKRRKEGKFIKDGVKYNRNEKQKGEVGNDGEVRFTNDVSLPFKYKLVEAETIQPSHENGIRNPLHFIPEAQPKNRNDIGSLQAEESFANNPRFEELGENTNAYSGSPVVNERGEVIQGNNRSAGLRKGYQRGNARYKNDLANNAEKFGFTKEQVESMDNPVLVREIAVSDAGAIELGNYDVKDLETGGKRRLDPISITRRMPFELKGRISEVLFKGDETLNKSLRDNSKKILELLSPYLNQSQKNTLFKDGALTEAGAKDLETVVQHFLFDGGDVALPDLFESLSYTQKEGLRKSLPSIFSTTSDKSITPQIQEAIIAINSFNESGINSFDNWLSQTDMFNEGKTPNDTFSPTAIAIAKILNIGSQKEIVAEFAKYADVVKDKPATMFEDAIKGISKKEAIKQIFKTEYNETAEQKAIGTRGGKEAIGKQEAIEKTKPKTKPTESQSVKDYKEAVTKASKKAKENAKKEFVDRNFDLIIEKLKIQIKCPT
jgi:hypothetical protein